MLKVDAVADSLRREGNEILHHQITEVFRGNRPGDAWLVSQRLRSAGCAFCGAARMAKERKNACLKRTVALGRRLFFLIHAQLFQISKLEQIHILF